MKMLSLIIYPVALIIPSMALIIPFCGLQTEDKAVISMTLRMNGYINNGMLSIMNLNWEECNCKKGVKVTHRHVIRADLWSCRKVSIKRRGIIVKENIRIIIKENAMILTNY